MTANNSHASVLLSIIFALTITGCSNSKEQQSAPTLADIDTKSQAEKQKRTRAQKKSQDEIRSAYRKYVESAASHDSSRQRALTRLAQLELELSNTLIADSEEAPQPEASASLNRTIELLETTLKDYPDAKDNDTVLYQLAQAYDQAGRYQDSIDTLNTLIAKYPASLVYPEAQFRIAESAFARSDYITAEDAYTEVILAPLSEKFYEKSLFKRGWTRYKQQLYSESVEDYVSAIEQHDFKPYDTLNDSEKTQFDEYLRALALAFANQPRREIQDYFSSKSDFKYIYETYAVVGDIYLKQERFSDAAQVLEQYTRVFSGTPNTPKAELKVISAWQQGGFTSRLNAAIERFYQNYRPDADYWKVAENEATFKPSTEKLREYITQISSYYHDRYQNKGKAQDFQNAKLWYERYLAHYKSHANKDNIYALFAELLLRGKQTEKAMGYFSLAAYDGDIILDKKAAYTTITLSNTLIDASKDTQTKKQWLDKHFSYAQRFVELYPKDKRSESIALSAAERAFSVNQYEVAIQLANAVPDSANEKTRFNANNVKARSYLELAQFADAEATYLELLESQHTSKRAASGINESLALAIYRQGEQAQKDGQTDIALNNFIRISRIAPRSKLASTGLYDAIALSMKNASWNQSIALIEEFKSLYPRHERIADVSKKLSVAYLNSDQKGKAAQEFERIAKIEDNLEVKMAALWQAAELYESKNNTEAAIRAYRDYAHTYKTPYEQNMEAMFKLSNLYAKQRDTQKQFFWQNRIRRADQKATRRVKTDRTTFIASTTTLNLARQKKSEFAKVKLVEPIANNLRRKKAAMQESVKLFGQASSYGIQEITTEATSAIGNIYLEFSQALLDSERPKNLNADELEQYDILLEDQAFPFEEKAIEFYETNMARTQEDVYDTWTQESFNQLVKLFPVRYQRKGKTDVFSQ